MKKYTRDLQPNGILAFEGPDSIKFLQGQTTCHLDQLTETNALYGAFCNPKGRIKTTFLLVKRSEESLLLLLSKTQCDYMRQQLQPYIAFFKSEISDVTDQFNIVGLIDGQTNTDTANDFTVNHSNQLIEITIPGTPQRKIIVATEEFVTDTMALAEAYEWHEADINNGLVWISAENREQFLPHDINLPGLGGVSYDKGCYTGQEIVARMHYRGNPKYTTAVLVTDDKEAVFESPLKAVLAADKLKTIGHPISKTVTNSDKVHILASINKDLLEEHEILLANDSEKSILCNISKPFLG